MRKNTFINLSITYIICVSLCLGILISTPILRFYNFVIFPFITLIGAIFLYRNRQSLDEILIPEKILETATTYMQLKSMNKTGQILNMHDEEVKRTIIEYIRLTSKYL